MQVDETDADFETELPKDVPYYGSHGGGIGYGPAQFACDGREFRIVEVGVGGDFVVTWDSKHDRPMVGSLTAVRRYRRVRDRMKRLFKRLGAPV